MISPSGPGLEHGEVQDLRRMVKRNDLELSGKRRSGIIARENLSIQVVRSDDEDDSDIWEVPDLEHREDGTPPPKRRRSRRSTHADVPETKIGKGVYVGHCIAYPEAMPVRAIYYANGSLNCRVLREDAPEDVIARQPGFFAVKSQVTMPFLQLDPVLFGDIANKELTDEEKKEAIRDYLVECGIPKPPTARRPRKVVKPRNHLFDLRVGCLADNHERPIWAFLKGNSICFRVHNGEGEDESLFSHGYRSFRDQIAYSMVKLDDNFVRGDEAETKDYIKTLLEELRSRIESDSPLTTQQPPSEFPTSIGDHTQSFTSSNMAPMPTIEELLSTSKPTTTCDYSLDMLVGCLKSDPNCEVYAYIQSRVGKSCLNFRFHFTAENKYLQTDRSNGLVTFDAINIDPKFLRESSEQTKAHIKTSIEELHPELRSDVRTSTSRSSLPTLTQVDDRDSRSRSRVDETPRRSSHVRGGRIIREFDAHKTTPSGTDPALSRQKATIDAQRYIIEGRNTYRKTLSNRESLISWQKATIDAQRNTINALQNKVKAFEAPQDPNSLGLDNSAHGIQELTIHDKLYRVLDRGPNAGKYLQVKPSRIEADGKSYFEWIALSEIKLHMDSHGEIVPFIHNGIEVYRVPDGKQQGLLVQTIGPNSIFELEDQKFVRWVVRKEIPDEKLNI